MKNILRIFLAAFLIIPVLSSCSKDSETIDFTQLVGTWNFNTGNISMKAAGQPFNQAMGSQNVKYIFNADNTFEEKIEGVTTTSGTYSYNESAKTITLTAEGAASGITYQVVTLSASVFNIQAKFNTFDDLIRFVEEQGEEIGDLGELEGFTHLITDIRVVMEFKK